MASLSVIFVEAVPQALRGTVSRWMIEPTAGLFVGPLPQRVRAEVWMMIVRTTTGHATMIEPADNEQGYHVHTHGPQRREPIDIEGLTLIRFE